MLLNWIESKCKNKRLATSERMNLRQNKNNNNESIWMGRDFIGWHVLYIVCTISIEKCRQRYNTQHTWTQDYQQYQAYLPYWFAKKLFSNAISELNQSFHLLNLKVFLFFFIQNWFVINLFDFQHTRSLTLTRTNSFETVSTQYNDSYIIWMN